MEVSDHQEKVDRRRTALRRERSRDQDRSDRSPRRTRDLRDKLSIRDLRDNIQRARGHRLRDHSPSPPRGRTGPHKVTPSRDRVSRLSARDRVSGTTKKYIGPADEKMAEMRLRSEQQRLRVEKEELRLERRDVERRRRMKECWEKEQREGAKRVDTQESRRTTVPEAAKEAGASKAKEKVLRKRTRSTSSSSTDATRSDSSMILELGKMYDKRQEQMRTGSGENSKEATVEDKTRRIEQRARDSSHAEEIAKLAAMINQIHPADSKLGRYRRSMLQVLASHDTDPEDQGLPEETRRLSKLTRCLEKKNAPKIREKQSSSSSSGSDSSSDEDQSQKANERRLATRRRRLQKSKE